jgi:hypothetical protein
MASLFCSCPAVLCVVGSCYEKSECAIRLCVHVGVCARVYVCSVDTICYLGTYCWMYHCYLLHNWT